MNTGTVVGLLFSCCPSYVAGGVRSVVVNAVKRCSWEWSGPHVSQKVFKHLPTLANVYATPSVPIPILVIFVSTALAHAQPLPILRAHDAPACCSVCLKMTTVESAAFTGDNISRTQERAARDAGVPAVAETHPQCTAKFVDACVGGDSQFTKAKSDHVLHGFVHEAVCSHAVHALSNVVPAAQQLDPPHEKVDFSAVTVTS